MEIVQDALITIKEAIDKLHKQYNEIIELKRENERLRALLHSAVGLMTTANIGHNTCVIIQQALTTQKGGA